MAVTVQGYIFMYMKETFVAMFSTQPQVHNGWIESALESAIRGLVNIWPQAFEEEFGQGEKMVWHLIANRHRTDRH